MTATALEPTDAATAAQMLVEAARDGRRLVPTGNGTKLDAIAFDRQATPLSSLRLNVGIAHYAGDLVATVPAGSTLSEVNAILAANDQWLPLDPPFPGRATIGGIVAANDSGPRRQRYGAPRDLIIGIEVALTNGSVVHAGGRVVKNVAGYDVARLFCGSRGSLGMITSVTFKLAPLPQASCTVVARFRSAVDAAAAALQVASSPLTPSTIELASPEPRLLLRFESTPHAARRMADAATTLLAPASVHVELADESAEAAEWTDVDSLHGSSELVLNVAVLPTASIPLLTAIDRAAAECGVAATVSGRAGLGVYVVGVAGSAEATPMFATAVRAAAHQLRGHVQLSGAAKAFAEAARHLGDLPGTAAAVGHAVKQRFDPAGTLPAPWSGDVRG